MHKTAFVFPGQGAQYTGMGKDFYETYPAAREVFALAGEVTGLSMEELIFEENEKLHQTEYTQIAMLATEVAIWKVLEEKGIKADVCAGLSLGEYGALAVCRVMELPELFPIIRKRGLYMQEAYPVGGAMTAVLGLETDQVDKACQETPGIVSVANYNCPGQFVISGEEKAVAEAAKKLQECGARRCIPLKVSGPFHSKLLLGAGEKLGEELSKVTVKTPVIPYISNVTADYVTEEAPIRELLEKQVSSPVRFMQSIERMLADGVDTFVEIGPGKTLSGFIRKMSKEVRVLRVEKTEDLQAVMEGLSC